MPNAETTATSNWREAFAQAESLEQAPRESQRAQIEALAERDPQLAHRVDLLLGGDTTAGEFDASVTRALAKTRVATAAPLKADDIVGAYTLIRRLGKGGMADVWLAQRTDGAIKRPVALKLPMALMPSPMLAERFARERDMLAQLDHPNIARIYDTGTTTSGQPFLALEFIDGEPLNFYCRAAKSTIKQRVQLAIQIAHAVHHAHSRLVLHRDLKPSNILVTANGTVKVLDFGIAKLLSEEHTAEETQFTRFTGSALTPKYAAPEQFLSETVTTSTDVYALAVVLFELLSGELPFAGNASELNTRLTAINTPCKLLSECAISAPQVAEIQASAVRSVQRELLGDLTAILDKALRRAPIDRYGSALAFAEDLQSYLTNRPVLARQGALTYRVRKFLIRHRVPVAVAAMGTIAAAGLGVQAITQSQRAAQSQSRADSIDGLMESLFQGMSPDVAAKRTFIAKELLDRASGYLGNGEQVHSATTLNANARMGDLYRDIGEYKDAIKIYANLLAKAERRSDLPKQIELQRQLADCAWRAQDFDSARKYVAAARGLIKSKQAVSELELARLANIEGSLNLRAGEIEKTISLFTEAEKLWRRLQPENVSQIAWALEGHAWALQSRGDHAAAREKIDTVLALDQKYPTRGALERLNVQGQSATLDSIGGKFAQAQPILKRVCDNLVERLGADHPEAHFSCFSFAYASIRIGDWESARSGIEGLANSRGIQQFGDERALQLQALAAMYRGASAEAEAGFLRILAAMRSKPDSGDSVRVILRFERYAAEAALRAGRTAEACTSLERIERQSVAAQGVHAVDIATVRILLAVCALRNEDKSNAKTLLSEAILQLEKHRGGYHPFTLAAYAYRELCSATEHRTVIVDRLRKELGWQSGAPQLIELIERRDGKYDPAATPVVL
jgi:eukaryotic-like serine/threonine-protein kinase